MLITLSVYLTPIYFFFVFAENILDTSIVSQYARQKKAVCFIVNAYG
jgi:hypothetical protein